MGQKPSKTLSRQDAIEALFKESSHPWLGHTCACCSTCGGGDPSLCECARERFMKKLTEDDITAFLNRDKNWKTTRALDIEKAWIHHCKQWERVKNMPCKKCRVANQFTCACAKKFYIKHLTYGEMEYTLKKIVNNKNVK